MRSRIVLAGNAVTASILEGYLSEDNRYELVATAVDEAFRENGGVQGLSNLIVDELPALFAKGEFEIILGVGYGDLNRNRDTMANRLESMGFSIATYIHPSAKVLTREPVGRGSVILPNAVIEPHAKVGRNVMLWCNTTIGHHSDVGDNCWVASGTVVAGQARVGKNTFLGVNATVTNQVNVGDFNIIGAGALITKNTKDSTVHLARSAEPLPYSAEDYSRLLLR